jgi:2-dehydro-3-deoxyglucarate aldolase/4-hydroxy-2-oxoheptanedioate aldolase
MDAVYDDICRQVRETDLLLGAAIGANQEDAKRVRSKGVQWVVFGQDSRILAEGLRDNIRKVGLEG